MRDVIVQIGADRTAHIESWLLGHGRIPTILPDPPSGRFRYFVKEAQQDEVDYLKLLGGVILSSPKAVRGDQA